MIALSSTGNGEHTDHTDDADDADGHGSTGKRVAWLRGTATGGTAGDRQCSAKFSPMFTNGEHYGLRREGRSMSVSQTTRAAA